MAKSNEVTFPQAFHDFSKSNGSDTRVFNREPSLTRQEFAEECDINSLMKRYEGHVIGGPGNMSALEPSYMNWVDMPQDLLGYLEFVKAAEASFMSLPALVRREFDNSAIDFVAYASDPGNLEQMREWGLAPPAKAPEPAAGVPQVPPGPAAPAATPGASAAPGGVSTHGPT